MAESQRATERPRVVLPRISKQRADRTGPEAEGLRSGRPRFSCINHSRLILISQVSAWKLRGNLPHAVESTWILTEAVLIDEKPVEQMPVFAIKAAYITAISRYVSPSIFESSVTFIHLNPTKNKLRDRPPRLPSRIQIQSLHVHSSAEDRSASFICRFTT